MWQTKYAATIPKNLGLGLSFRPCSEGYFLSGLPQSVAQNIRVCSIGLFSHFPKSWYLVASEQDFMQSNISLVVNFKDGGSKKQDFWPRFFLKSDDVYQKVQNCTFKVNFGCQKSTEFFQKKTQAQAKYFVQKIRWLKPKQINK